MRDYRDTERRYYWTSRSVHESIERNPHVKSIRDKLVKKRLNPVKKE